MKKINIMIDSSSYCHRFDNTPTYTDDT